MVRLFGSPEQIGGIWGEMNKGAIIRDMDATYLRRAAEAGIARDTLIERGKEYNRIVDEIAPHWHEETRAIARAAGVDEDLFLAFYGSVSRGRFLHAGREDAASQDRAHDGGIVECTSYAVSRDRASGGAVFFHKTRDNTDRPQVAVIVESSLEGVNKFVAVSDVSTLNGHSMMVNDKGLAGAADYPADRKKDSSTLSLPAAAPQYRGLMAGAIMRHIAERASSSAEALAIIEDFVAKRYYAGGEIGGSHWLFVDRDCTVLEVCSNARHVVSKVHTQGAYFSRFNKSEPVQRLREADKVDFQMFHGVSREQPILTHQSISGMTVEIDPARPDLLTVAWIALPARVAAFPVFMGQLRTPAVLADGTAYALGKRTASRGDQWEAQRSRWEALEAAMHAERQELTQEVRESIAAGNPLEGDIEQLESWSRDQAATIVEALKNPN